VPPPEDETPAGRAPIVTLALVAANVAAHLWQRAVGLEQSARRAGAIPFEILTLQDVEWRAVVAPPLTVLTSMFLHGGAAHVAQNLVALWIFGRGVEPALGRARFALLYATCGVVGALAQSIAAALSGQALVPIVGASGAIAGVLAAHLVAAPRGRVLGIPTRALIVGWFAVQVLSLVLGGDPGVAFTAHVGGFVAGWLAVRVLGPGARWRARGASW
jgi:membrane associated rhomboid family serine protease